jgi:hypothetical protein
MSPYKGGQHINKLPPGGLRGEAFYNKVYSTAYFERYPKRLLKALKDQNIDYRVYRFLQTKAKPVRTDLALI